MARHTDNAFGRKDHGSRTDFIVTGVTAAAGFILLRHLHLVNRTDPIRTARTAPPNLSAVWISCRLYAVEVADAAGHGGVQVVGFLFVVRPVALTAGPRCLIAVFEGRGPGVTDQAVNIRVRCRGIS